MITQKYNQLLCAHKLFLVIISIMIFALFMTFSAQAGENNMNPTCWENIVIGNQSISEKLATIDLQRYLAQVTGNIAVIQDAAQWRSNPVPAVIVGIPRNNPLLKNLIPSHDELGNQGYFLNNLTFKNTKVVIAAGQTSAGAVHAVYGLLKELGYGFYLGSEAPPSSLPPSLSRSPIMRKPVLKIRGVLPWYNFFNSPTTWDPIDHRTIVDQLIRMGANFVGFHTYNQEPFAAYDQNGNMVWGKRLLNTQSPTWGTHPMPTSQFAFGTGNLYAHDYFGASTTRNIQDRNEAIRCEQNIMRDAFDYAKKRGVHTCLGFEINGDPTQSNNRAVFLARLNHVLDQYPALDYLWIWEPETQGVQGYRQRYDKRHQLDSKLDFQSPLVNYGKARREVFHRAVERTAGEKPFFKDNEEGKTARANEGARLELFAQLAYRTLAKRENPPKLIISGWGGDERLLSAEYYDGLDKLLPKDVIFSSLDHIWTRPRVDAVYNELPSSRERWPIPWLEVDGDEWQPQPRVHAFHDLARNLYAGGSQGVLGIHWRTREVEENLAYLVDFAWNPQLTATQFFADLAKRCYDPDIADQMATVHAKLDELGYRWVGGWGQSECAPFRFSPGLENKAQALQQIRKRVAGLLPKADKGKQRVQWLLTRIDWVLAYYEFESNSAKAEKLLADAKSAYAEKAKLLAAQALPLLDEQLIRKAMQTYAKRVSTRGEYGVLATINTKAVVAWRNLRNDCMKILERPIPEEQNIWNPQPQIILPRLIGSTIENQSLQLFPIVLGGPKTWIHYRELGENNWNTQLLTEVKGWVQSANIPAAAVTQPGLEFGFSFNQNPDDDMAYGPIAVTVLPKLDVNTIPPSTIPTSPPGKLQLKISKGQTSKVELNWNDIPQADYFKVYRNDNLISETPVTFFPDNFKGNKATYIVEAWLKEKCITRSKPVSFATSGQ